MRTAVRRLAEGVTSRRLAILTLAGGIVVGVLVSQFVGRSRDKPGPKLRRDCVSLVETAMNEDRTVPRWDLERALTARGVNVPPSADDAKWEEIRRHPRYNEAWEVVFNERRDKAIKDCILKRARREGVDIR